MGYFLKNRVTPTGSTGIGIPVGNNADRPTHPTVGFQRFNTDLDDMEYWSGTEWKTVTTSGTIIYTMTSFVGDGTTATFSPIPPITTVGQSDQYQVFVNGLFQMPPPGVGNVYNYSVTGNAITFTSPPPLAAPINVISTVN